MSQRERMEYAFRFEEAQTNRGIRMHIITLLFVVRILGVLGV